MFDVSSRAKLSVSALAERKIASARPRKYGLLLRAEEEMLLYGQALARTAAGPCNSTFTPSVVATRATTANGEIGFSSSRDVCRVTIHSDARGLCPNRNDGHDLRAPYARDHDRGRRVPERCRCRFAQRREPAATSASPRPVAWVLSPMRRERRQRSAENDSFGISPLGRGCAAQGNVPAPRKFRPKQR